MNSYGYQTEFNQCNLPHAQIFNFTQCSKKKNDSTETAANQCTWIAPGDGQFVLREIYEWSLQVINHLSPKVSRERLLKRQHKCTSWTGVPDQETKCTEKNTIDERVYKNAFNSLEKAVSITRMVSLLPLAGCQECWHLNLHIYDIIMKQKTSQGHHYLHGSVHNLYGENF